MIVIKVESWPKGDRSKSKLLGVAAILNDNSGSVTHGHYDAYLVKPDGLKVLEDSGGSGLDNMKNQHGKGRVEEYPRTSIHFSIWDLVFRALVELRGKRNTAYMKNWFIRKPDDKKV